jgi:O-antigen/teichoic acid export membrane protein
VTAEILDSAVPYGRRVSRNVLTLGAGELLSRLIGFGATIYVARQLGAGTYGIIGFGFAVLLYLAAVTDGGLEHTGPREVAEAGPRVADLVMSVLVARLVGAAILTAVLALVALAFFNGPERTVLSLYALALLPVGANLRWVHVGLDRTGSVAASRLLAEGLKVALILLLVHGPASIMFVPLAQLAGDSAGAALLIVGLPRAGIRLRPRVDVSLARGVLRRAFPMLIAGFLGIVVYNSDLIFLRIFREVSELGLYLAAYTLISFLGISGHLVGLSLLPSLTRLRDAPRERDALYQSALARVFAVGLPAAAGACIVARPLIDLVFGPGYSPSAGVLRVLIWSIPLVLMRGVPQAALLSTGHARRALQVTMLAAGTNVSLNFIAVPLLGMYGAALTTVAAELVRVTAAHRYAHRAGLPLPIPAYYWRPVVATALMAGGLLVMRPMPLWATVLLGAAGYVVAFFLLGELRIGRKRAPGLDLKNS